MIGRLTQAGTAEPAGLGNGGDGIELQGANNIIGGTAANLRNVIAENNQSGIHLTGAGATGNQVLGNYIGVAANGTTASVTTATASRSTAARPTTLSAARRPARGT